jgi:hypothetical protein
MNVSILNNPTKVLMVSGKFMIEKSENENGFLNSSVVNCPISVEYMDIRKGTWNVCLKDILISKQINFPEAEVIKEYLIVSTNIVDGKRLNNHKGLEIFNPPFERILYESDKANYKAFSKPTWLTVSCPSTHFDLKFNFWPEFKPSDHFFSNISQLTANVTATMLFQRLQ